VHDKPAAQREPLTTFQLLYRLALSSAVLTFNTYLLIYAYVSQSAFSTLICLTGTGLAGFSHYRDLDNWRNTKWPHGRQ